MWVGATNAANKGTWKWSDKTRFNYTNWDTNADGDDEPNNFEGDENCLEFRTDGKWNDLKCSDFLHFVCKINGI